MDPMRTLLCLAVAALSVHAVEATRGDADAQPVRVKDVSWCRLDDGRPAMLVRFAVDHDWHMYWTNPGDSGAPPTAKATLPEGWRLGSPIWPRPRVQRTDGETVYVHEGEWGWLLPVEGPQPRAMPERPIDLSLSWMACRRNCVVGRASVRVPPPVGTVAARPESVGGSPFPVEPQAEDAVTVAPDRLRIRCRARGRMSASFIQATNPGVAATEDGAPVAVPIRDGIAEAELPLVVRPQDADGKELAISGLLLLGDRPTDPCVWIRRAIPAAVQTSAPASAQQP
jgi:DsbC/DsbD-like thiol-disulfide interchange protein